MGLTVHYQLRVETASSRAAKQIVNQLRERALMLPFDLVGPLEIVETVPGSSPWDDDAPPLWLDSIEDLCRGEDSYDIPPLHGFAFTVIPGPGCESASFGLAEYPKTIVLDNGRRARTGLTGWSWRSFCKTQYASNPRHGGFENFRRCHVSLVELLDAAAEIGLHTRITDESRYATHRNLDQLRQEIGEWNEFIAGGIGRLKDALGGEADAPITEYPNYEHLEAKGRSKAK